MVRRPRPTWTVTPGSRGLIIGPKLELKLPGIFSLEADASAPGVELNHRHDEFFSAART